jgi:hypothetical protein
MGLWMGLRQPSPTETIHPNTSLLTAHNVGTAECWASLRSVRFNFRPAHADQLHVDLWAFGENICCDAGTYLYNNAPPWNNSLAGTLVHNTISINEKDQMTRAGRFLWLNPAQAKMIISRPDEIVAEHNGYASLGWIHRRSLKYASTNTFIVTDRLLPIKKTGREIKAIIHWLLPDWPHKTNQNELILFPPFGKVVFNLMPQTLSATPFIHSSEIIRAGINLNNDRAALEYLGWFSPVYGIKKPALSYRVLFSTHEDISLITRISIHKTLT